MTKFTIPDKPIPRRDLIKAELDAAVAAYQGPITVLPGFETIQPKRRTGWIDPDAERPKREQRKEITPWMTERRRQAYEEKKRRNAAARGEK